MIQPFVSRNFPYLRVAVTVGTSAHAPDFTFTVEPLVDTGFDGGLSVPVGLIPATVPAIGLTPWTLADGTGISATTYIGYITIGGFPPVPTLIVAASDDPLLGRLVTDGFSVHFDHGRRIVVEV